MVKFFINRPIFATVLALIIVVAGLVTLNILPIAQYPEITPPTVQVSAVYPGADAQTVAQTVGLPIEYRPEQLAGTRDRTRYHHPQAILQYRDDAYPKFQGFHLRRVVFK